MRKCAGGGGERGSLQAGIHSSALRGALECAALAGIVRGPCVCGAFGESGGDVCPAYRVSICYVIVTAVLAVQSVGRVRFARRECAARVRVGCASCARMPTPSLRRGCRVAGRIGVRSRVGLALAAGERRSRRRLAAGAAMATMAALAAAAAALACAFAAAQRRGGGSGGGVRPPCRLPRSGCECPAPLFRRAARCPPSPLLLLPIAPFRLWTS